jgi:hypothetical protein
MKKIIVLLMILYAGLAWGAENVTIDGECCDCFGRSCDRIDLGNGKYAEIISARFGTWFGYGKDGPATFSTSMGESKEEFINRHKDWQLIKEVHVNNHPDIYGEKLFINGEPVTRIGGTLITNDAYVEVWLRRYLEK